MKRPAFLKRWQYARGYGASRRVALRNALGLQRFRPILWTKIKWNQLKEKWRWVNPWTRWRCDHVHDLLIYRDCQHMICRYCGSRSWKKEKKILAAEDHIKTIDPRYLP